MASAQTLPELTLYVSTAGMSLNLSISKTVREATALIVFLMNRGGVDGYPGLSTQVLLQLRIHSDTLGHSEVSQVMTNSISRYMP